MKWLFSSKEGAFGSLSYVYICAAFIELLGSFGNCNHMLNSSKPIVRALFGIGAVFHGLWGLFSFYIARMCRQKGATDQTIFLYDCVAGAVLFHMISLPAVHLAFLVDGWTEVYRIFWPLVLAVSTPRMVLPQLPIHFHVLQRVILLPTNVIVALTDCYLYHHGDWSALVASFPFHLAAGLLCLAISVIVDVLLQNRLAALTCSEAGYNNIPLAPLVDWLIWRAKAATDWVGREVANRRQGAEEDMGCTGGLNQSNFVMAWTAAIIFAFQLHASGHAPHYLVLSFLGATAGGTALGWLMEFFGGGGEASDAFRSLRSLRLQHQIASTCTSLRTPRDLREKLSPMIMELFPGLDRAVLILLGSEVGGKELGLLGKHQAEALWICDGSASGPIPARLLIGPRSSFERCLSTRSIVDSVLGISQRFRDWGGLDGEGQGASRGSSGPGGSVASPSTSIAGGAGGGGGGTVPLPGLANWTSGALGGLGMSLGVPGNSAWASEAAAFDPVRPSLTMSRRGSMELPGLRSPGKMRRGSVENGGRGSRGPHYVRAITVPVFTEGRLVGALALTFYTVRSIVDHGVLRGVADALGAAATILSGPGRKQMAVLNDLIPKHLVQRFAELSARRAAMAGGGASSGPSGPGTPSSVRSGQSLLGALGSASASAPSGIGRGDGTALGSSSPLSTSLGNSSLGHLHAAGWGSNSNGNWRASSSGGGVGVRGSVGGGKLAAADSDTPKQGGSGDGAHAPLTRRGSRRDLDPSAALRSALPLDVSDFMEEHTDVVVLVADIVDYTAMASRADPREVMEALHSMYSLIDGACLGLGLLKLDTIGDMYLAIGNVETRGPDQALRILRLAERMHQVCQGLYFLGRKGPRLRIGIDVGSGVSGLIGKIRKKYLLQGQPLTIATRLESLCSPEHVHMSDKARAAAGIKSNAAGLRERLVRVEGRLMKSYQIAADAIPAAIAFSLGGKAAGRS